MAFGDIQIDKESGELPLYQQVVSEVVRLIESGVLAHGTKLPTIRALSKELSVTRVTIHKAYHELKEKGWVEATVGKGTFVKHAPASLMEPMEGSIHRMTADKAMADIHAVRSREGTLTLAMGEPDPRLYPAASFVRLFRGMEERSPELLRYGSYQGDPQLRQMIAGRLVRKGIATHFDDVLLTTGVTQGLSLSVAALCEPGDKILVEEPTYLGFLSLLKSYKLEPLGVPLGEEGPCLEQLERLMLRHRPRVYYTIPSFHNPSGVEISPAIREGIVELARRYHVTLLEDDVYGDIRFEGPAPLPLKALYPEGVVYASSFSKVLFPGLRIGYVSPPAHLKHELMTLIRCRSLCGPRLMQQTLAEFLARGGLEAHLASSLPVYRSRRDALLAALQRQMPAGVEWSTPKGGFSAWLRLPAGGNYEDLYRNALAEGVSFTPGAVFFSHSHEPDTLRLCFSVLEEPQLQQAVAILGRLIRACLASPWIHLSPTPIV